ncbi:MAG: helix-turn-helix domain-containing protein [Deltaproteobacteria bacterium]|nr:helix-turn-helix domain-containing protein [Deltaproteobacteria bacterium]
MNQMTEGRFTFTEAALAAGVPPKTLRGWLDRGKRYGIGFDAEEKREGASWRRFSVLDVVRAALSRHLISSCVPVARAFEIAEDFLSAHSFGAGGVARVYRNVPVEMFFASTRLSLVLFWPSEQAQGGWDYYIQKLPAHVDNRADELVAAGVVVLSTLVANRVVEEVFRNLDLFDGEEDE